MFLCKSISTNMSFELVVGWLKETQYWWSFDCSFRTKGDHAGFMLYVNIWKFKFEFNVCDRRHWNYKEDRWFGWGEDSQGEDDV